MNQSCPRMAIIGGTGLTALADLTIVHREVVHTPYGEPSGPITHGLWQGSEVVFLPRHGALHTIPPHRINYRANLWALKHIGVSQIIAIAAVGGIAEDLPPRALAVPDQIIDYTYSRDHTFFDGELTEVTHIDFTYPYDENLRQLLLRAAELAQVPVVSGGTYGATQGPRLETRAEIQRMKGDGCSMVGMTGMPEAALARELGLAYATLALSANWAAGLAGDDEIISLDEIHEHVSQGMQQVQTLLKQALVLCATESA